MSCWIRLGIEPTHDQNVIRGAYRARLPEHHPETDPQGFQALREAYEAALQFARQSELAPPQALPPAAPAVITEVFAELLADSRRRFDPEAWRGFIRQLDQLPLEALEDASWELLHCLRSSGALSNACARLLAERLGWAQQLLRLSVEDADEIQGFLDRIAQPDPFPTELLNTWSSAAQQETLWYMRTLDYLFLQRPLFEYEAFATLHTCIAIPDDESLVQRLMVQFAQAGVASPTLLERCAGLQAAAPDDVDLLYLHARHSMALGRVEEALTCWARLHWQYQHPLAPQALLDLCLEHLPQWQPLLIQALDRLSPITFESGLGLDHPKAILGSPAQTPETLTRWLAARRLALGGIAGCFVDWRIDGDDELPLLAHLLDPALDPDLQRLYRHAWALQRGDVGALRQILAEPAAGRLIDELILRGFKYQAEQQLRWLEQAPIPLALQAFLSERRRDPQWPAALGEGQAPGVCREWLRRLRGYDGHALKLIRNHFALQRMFPVPFALDLQGRLAEHDVLLPTAPDDDSQWHWHAGNLFMLALLEQPKRWLEMTSPQVLATLVYPAGHPFAATHALLLRHLDDANELNVSGLLGWFDPRDPLQELLAQQLCTARSVLQSPKLPSTRMLYQRFLNDRQVFADDLLGMMLFWGALYHDPALHADERRRLLAEIEAVTCFEPWFADFRALLTKGWAKRPPKSALQAQGIDAEVFNLALDVLSNLSSSNEDGVPRISVLQKLQRAKDDPRHGFGLRLALTALLSWSERLLQLAAEEPPASPLAVWHLGSRLGRKAYAVQLLAWPVLGLLMLTQGLTPLTAAVLAGLGLLSAALRRLHDCGHGLLMLLAYVVLSVPLSFLPLVLCFIRPEPLPNRYGRGPEQGAQGALEDGLQAALRRLNG